MFKASGVRAVPDNRMVREEGIRDGYLQLRKVDGSFQIWEAAKYGYSCIVPECYGGGQASAYCTHKFNNIADAMIEFDKQLAYHRR